MASMNADPAPSNVAPGIGTSNLIKILIPIALIILCVVGYFLLFKNTSVETVVVYVAHDKVYSEEILREFEKETGIKVIAVYDSEATKSLGLVERLKAEKEAPQADVFWNNELFGTMELQNLDVLEPYKGEGWGRIPDQYKDPEGYWVGFGARMRVVIFNTEQVPQIPVDFMADEQLNLNKRFVYAKPIYGSTLTHMAVMWYILGGEEGFSEWYTRLNDKGARQVDGNGPVKDRVASGAMAFGWTDTDDYFLAEEAGDPVMMLPIFVKTGFARQEASTDLVPAHHQVILFPNTAAKIKGSPNPDAAKQLIDFLASRDNEVRLANSRARQIPLGDYGDAQLPEQVKRLQPYIPYGVILGESTMSQARDEVLEWLKKDMAK